jgi:ABC-type polysaccharide transport system permease subunit
MSYPFVFPYNQNLNTTQLVDGFTMMMNIALASISSALGIVGAIIGVVIVMTAALGVMCAADLSRHVPVLSWLCKVIGIVF